MDLERFRSLLQGTTSTPAKQTERKKKRGPAVRDIAPEKYACRMLAIVDRYSGRKSKFGPRYRSHPHPGPDWPCITFHSNFTPNLRLTYTPENRKIASKATHIPTR